LALAGSIGLVSLAAVPAPVQAGDFSIGLEFGSHNRRTESVVRIERTARVWVPPVYRTVCEQVWVPPTYRTVCERVWVPDRYEERVESTGYGPYRRTRTVRVLVEPAHYEEIERQIEVAAGYYRTVERQELVQAGYWEERPTYSFGGVIRGRIDNDHRDDWRDHRRGDRKDDWRDNRRDDGRGRRDDERRGDNRRDSDRDRRH
jgi:hypothetical protein